MKTLSEKRKLDNEVPRCYYWEDDVKEKIKDLMEELDWTNIKDGSGAWTSGQIKIAIIKHFGKEWVE